MNTGFADVPADPDFARRSAHYLAGHGYQPGQIHSALVEQLDLTDASALDILSVIAA